MKIIKYFLLLILIKLTNSICNLPPDFWCDHPKISLECTGTLQYCDQYKSTRNNSPLKLKLAFETACPDSQQFVINRLYPQLLSKNDLLSLIDFKAYPWGLAKKGYDKKVKCHHGIRECNGNKLLTCGLLYYINMPSNYGKLLNCFMNSMMYRQIPKIGMKQCLERLQTPQNSIDSILHCGETSQSDDLQKYDEIETLKILNNPRFVPYISINDHSHLHMQAYQMFLGNKIKIWNNTLSLISPTNQPKTRCSIPSDFWCTDPSFIHDCYNQQYCTSYLSLIYGKKINVKIIYDSNIKTSVDYILNYIKPYLSRDSKVFFEIEPTPTPKCNIKTLQCKEHALQECIATKITNPTDKTNILLCLLENRVTGMLNAWNNRCHYLQTNYDSNMKNSIQKCMDSTEWETYSLIRAESHQLKLSPEPKRSDPWILINGYSLNSAQQYHRILHYMTCIWYRGPNHNRDACWRCSYEATHC